MLKGKFRPEKMVRKKMPDGSGMLAKLPERRKDDGLDAAAADKEYCDAIDKVAAVFGQQKRANSTADEHKRYIRTIDGWLVRKGFGSFVEAEVDKHGQLVAVHARRTASGEITLGQINTGCTVCPGGTGRNSRVWLQVCIGCRVYVYVLRTALRVPEVCTFANNNRGLSTTQFHGRNASPSHSSHWMVANAVASATGGNGPWAKLSGRRARSARGFGG